MSEHIIYPTQAGIYKLTCIENGKIYIGKAVNLRNRLTKHKHSSTKPIGKCYLQNAIIKYGWENFKVEILEIVENFDKLRDNLNLLELEARYIKNFESTNKTIGYNICEFSNDRTGMPLLEETKEKLSACNIGKKLSEETKEKIRNTLTGRSFSEERIEKIKLRYLENPMSQETKDKIKQSKIDNPMSEESRKKLREFNSGKIMSIESRAKMSEAKMGKPLSEETKKKIGAIHAGKKTSEETKEKMRQAHLKRRNKNN